MGRDLKLVGALPGSRSQCVFPHSCFRCARPLAAGQDSFCSKRCQQLSLETLGTLAEPLSWLVYDHATVDLEDALYGDYDPKPEPVYRIARWTEEDDDVDDDDEDDENDENDDAARFLEVVEARPQSIASQDWKNETRSVDSVPQASPAAGSVPSMITTDVRQAIALETWFDCAGNYYDESIRFRLRVLDFARTSAAEIDPQVEVEIEGDLWLLRVEVVSLCREPIPAYRVRDLISLVDHEDFRFDAFSSPLNYDRVSRLHRFAGSSDTAPLSPKIKATGAIAFQLPGGPANYRVAIRGGEIAPATPVSRGY